MVEEPQVESNWIMMVVDGRSDESLELSFSEVAYEYVLMVFSEPLSRNMNELSS